MKIIEEEFEQYNEYFYYEELIENTLKFDNLTIDEYSKFIEKIFLILLKREEIYLVLMFASSIKNSRNECIDPEQLNFNNRWGPGIVPAFLIIALKNIRCNFTDKDV
ncbi:MAG: hypothetical protein ACFFAN_14965 [Promethearchaeota archaeon]